MYHFDTGQVRCHERTSYWQESVCDTFVSLECRPHRADSFSGRLVIQPFSDINLVDVTASGQTVLRTRDRIARSDNEFVLVSLALGGKCIITQGGREAVLDAGSFAVYDTRHPYELRFEGGFRHTVVQIPRAMMQNRLTGLEYLTAIRLSRANTLERITFDFLLALTDLREHTESRRLQFQDQALDLLSKSLADRGCTSVPDNTRGTALLFRIKEHVYSYLGDSEMSLSSVAAYFGVTPRYVNSLLHHEGSSFGRFVLAARLERCARAMSQFEQRNKQISEIAYQWGFSDMAYFSRAFKCRYNFSPRDYRRDSVRLDQVR